MKRNGLTIGEQENTGSDPEFLAEMMELNEEIYEEDPTPQRLRDIRASNSGENGSFFVCDKDTHIDCVLKSAFRSKCSM